MHSIDGLFINRPSTDYVGLFGYITSSEIDSISLSNGDITGYESIGGLVGYNYNSYINNCCSTGSVNGTGYEIGGLVGQNNISTVSNCYAHVSVDGNFYVGGLVGLNYDFSTISNSYATGSVSGYSSTGGLVGSAWINSTISDSYATGSVTGIDNHAGGLVGKAEQNSIINNSYATGSVTATVTGVYEYAGGLVGCNKNSSVISNCYARGSVNSNYLAGGLVGNNYSSTVNYCYATGFVSGTYDYVGGLIGRNLYSATVDNSFWDMETSGQTSSDGGTGKSTAEMKDVATFTNLSTVGLDESWDFVGDPYNDTGTDDFWNIDGSTNDGYPFLSWQVGEEPPAAPTNVIITIVGDNVQLDWDDMGSSIFYIYRSQDPYQEYWERIGSSETNSYIDTDAGLESAYYYYVTVCD